MSDAVANDAMDALEACPCCLLGVQEHCMNSPLKNGEMYSDMLKECFSIQLVAANDKCGICTLCAARLRDAADLKRQVLRSQRQLRECLARAINIIEECPPVAVKSEIADDDGTSDNTLEPIKAEVREATENEDKCISDLYPDHVVKDEMVIGPERLQPADITYTLQAKVKPTPESECDEQSRGTGECSDVNPSPDCVRPSLTQVQSKMEPQFMVEEPERITVDVEWHHGLSSTEGEDVTAPPVSGACGLRNDIMQTAGVHNTPRQIRTPASKNSKTISRDAFKCSYCDHHSTNKSNLRLHERKHTGEKPYACSHCSYASASKSHLHLHERIHTGEKPYKCNHCSYSTTDKSNLLVHERKHTGEKPYKCSHCSYASTDKSTLQVHERVHTGEKPYTCNHCSYASARRSLLLVHERKHTAEKPYKCKHCNFASANKKCLQVHERNHTGEKPYKCRYCEYASSQKGNLLAHERRHANHTV